MIGLDTVPADDRPPLNTMLHWAFDTMVGIGTMLIALGLWLAFSWWRKRDIPQTKWFLRAVAVSGVATVVAMECGWIVTEVGRQPWIVYQVMRTEDAVTKADGIWVTFGLIVGLYAILGVALVLTLRAMARRWRSADEEDSDVPYGPSRASPVPAPPRMRREHRGRRRRRAVGRGDDVRGVRRRRLRRRLLEPRRGWGERGRRARELIDWAIGPVWEANHVWLIFVLVVLWTGFSSAFAAIFSTLFIPLSLAALGIVLRGSGFAFHKTARRTGGRDLAERLFGLSSLLTPFFMGTVVGAIASERVPPGNAAGDPVTSWLNPASLVIGALFVATSAYVSAVFLSATRGAPASPTSCTTSPSARSARRWSRGRSRSPASSSSTRTRPTSTTASRARPCRS